jgi:hypothetical protein
MFIANQTIVNKFFGGSNVSGLRARINLNATYEFNQDFSGELFGSYNAPKIISKGKDLHFYSII